MTTLIFKQINKCMRNRSKYFNHKIIIESTKKNKTRLESLKDETENHEEDTKTEIKLLLLTQVFFLITLFYNFMKLFILV